jgi:hypothetical protein
MITFKKEANILRESCVDIKKSGKEPISKFHKKIDLNKISENIYLII